MIKVDDLADGRLGFSVSVNPRASKNAVIGWTEGGWLKVSVTASPVDDAANQELVKLLSRVLEIRKTDVVISSGSRSRLKRLTVPRVAKNRLLSFTDI
ncbi:MAG: DUF167 domain-containing protein [Candidatus Latescibacterota bacterium]|nr:MAG: DUF167 domain-containing protein [Candidatus Latescibacterota bacterium]